MAKGKKAAKELTLEEKLAQALVPVEEQPYKIPENWCFVPQKIICKLSNGEKVEGEEYPYLEVKYLRGKKKADILTKGKYIKESTKVILVDGENSGEVFTVVEDGYMGSTFKALDISSVVNQDYLQYFIATKKELYRNNKKGSAIPHLNKELFFSMPFPLAPLAEQQRIVVRIESIFAKLDEAKEKAQEVIESFELRKSAILHKAFTGELTKKWREEHGETLESWKEGSLDAICNSLKYGTAKKSKKEGTVVVIRMGNLQQGEIDWSDLAYSDDQDDIEKYQLDNGDVLFNRTNSAALVGKTSIYRGEYPAIYAGYLIKLDYNHDIITGDFLTYALNTNNAKEYCNLVKTDGVNQSNINAKKIGAFVIPLPSIKEQEEVVRIVKKLIVEEKQAKEVAQAAIDQVEVMKKAVLARAFRGELGTNDSEEESAMELLKILI